MSQRPRAATRAQRERILTVAIQLFGERGVSNVSIPELMAAVGLTHGSFYWHFASKDDLACEACTRALAHEAAAVRRAAAAARSCLPGHQTTASLGLISETFPAPALSLAGFALDALRAPNTSGLPAAYTAGLYEVLRAYEEASGRDAALATIATRIGADVLVRAVGDPQLARRVAAAVEDAVALCDPRTESVSQEHAS